MGRNVPAKMFSLIGVCVTDSGFVRFKSRCCHGQLDGKQAMINRKKITNIKTRWICRYLAIIFLPLMVTWDLKQV